MESLKDQLCPMCLKKALTLTESNEEIHSLGKVFLFSMKCSACNFDKKELEVEENKGPSSYSFTIESKDDLKIRVIKSSAAKIKFPSMRTKLEPSGASEGYIGNIDGVLKRFEEVLIAERDSADNPKDKKTAKNLLKKLWKIRLGQLSLSIVIEDPTGNSAIISDKAEIKKIKG